MTDLAAEHIAKAIDRLGKKIDRLTSEIEKSAGNGSLLTSDLFQKAVWKIATEAIDDNTAKLIECFECNSAGSDERLSRSGSVPNPSEES